MSRHLCAALLLSALFIAACEKDHGANDGTPGTDDTLPSDGSPDEDLLLPDDGASPVSALFGAVTLNPSGAAPLTAEIPFTPDKAGTLSLRIECTAVDTDEVYEKRFSFTATGTITMPIFGLFPDCENVLTFTLFSDSGEERGVYTTRVTTAPLPDDFPIVTATGIYTGDAFTFFPYYRTLVQEIDSTVMTISQATGIMYDRNGTVRWYSDFPTPLLFPLEIIDGLLYGGGQTDDLNILHWSDLMGRPVGSIDLGALGFTQVHHDVMKKPDGNLIITADKIGNEYTMEHLIEVDPADGSLIRTWDLRTVFPDIADLFIDMPMTDPAYPGFSNDPVHLNAAVYDPTDDSIIVSSQRSGIAKIAADGTIRWLLAPHLIRYVDDADGDGISDSLTADYDREDPLTWVGDYTGDAYTDERMPFAGKPAAGYPFDFTYGEVLLTPLDGSGTVITDHDTLLGFTDSEEFRWPFRPHSPHLFADGTLMLFDNGLMRGFKMIDPSSFSRAPHYRIIPDTDGYGGTVEQIAEYIPLSDPAWHRFSPVVGDVDDLGDGTILITSGSLGSSFYPDVIVDQYGNGPIGAYVVQIDTATGEEIHSLLVERVINEAHPNASFSVYRAERIDPFRAFALPAGMKLEEKIP
ncbi:MAG TPA: aryl-sulfate sulfotransferase [bacterium]|nr:aryl-sulfate sulfotransferase [bacterium]